MVPNQGLQGIAFFEATACLTLLVLFAHLQKDNVAAFYKLWLLGWVSLTLSSFSELALFFGQYPILRMAVDGAEVFDPSSILAATRVCHRWIDDGMTKVAIVGNL